MPNCGSLMYLRIGEDQKFGPLLGAHMRDRGVFILEGFPSYLTAAHDDEDIDYVIDAIKDSALEMRADGMLTGREAVAYDGPKMDVAPPRLLLPEGPSEIAAAMARTPKVIAVPTTEAQREIWAALVVTPEVSAAYNESVILSLTGAIDTDALLAATRDGFDRHDALKSTFADDGLSMNVHASVSPLVTKIDLNGLEADAQQAQLNPERVD
jgi:hypothetical protein